MFICENCTIVVNHKRLYSTIRICENCTSVVYHKRLNCTNNENCTSVGGASALFNSCFRRSAASKLWDPKEENPILSKIKITYLIIVEVTFSNRFNAQTWLSYPSPSPSHQADNFYWQLNNRLHFSVKGLIWKCLYSTNFNLHLNFLQFIWNFKNATLMSWKLFRVKWCDIKLTWFHPQKNQYSECW